MRQSTLIIALPLLVFAVPAMAKIVLPRSPTAAATATGPRVRMTVDAVIPSEAGPVAVLRDEAGRRVMPVWIGDAEARAIQLALDGRRLPRPLTHDLLASVIDALGGTLVEVEVSELREDTFIGTAVIRTERGEVRRIDARPSDLMALALRTEVPIWVMEHVLADAQLDPPAQLRPRTTYNP